MGGSSSKNESLNDKNYKGDDYMTDENVRNGPL